MWKVQYFQGYGVIQKCEKFKKITVWCFWVLYFVCSNSHKCLPAVWNPIFQSLPPLKMFHFTSLMHKVTLKGASQLHTLVLCGSAIIFHLDICVHFKYLLMFGEIESKFVQLWCSVSLYTVKICTLHWSPPINLLQQRNVSVSQRSCHTRLDVYMKCIVSYLYSVQIICVTSDSASVSFFFFLSST